MAFYETSELKDLYEEAVSEADEWRTDYDEYERLANNGLLEQLSQEGLPEVNDGSLAAALFKLPKRIISSELTGRFSALDADEAWITELANITWGEQIVPNANSMAPFHRKWKDAIRKAAIYGGQPIINLFVNNGSYTGSDFIIPQAQDVKLEPGKVSDLDSDVIFWDIYYTKKQVRDLLEQAEEETSEDNLDGYNRWDVKAIKEILEGKHEEERPGNEEHEERKGKGVTKGGLKFCIAFQRGVKAPFYMYHYASDSTVREWENPDPTGDIPVHYLYCYQDFINPYGTGIVKLAGGTQNVLDYMRKADVLATQLGLKPPKQIQGNEDEVDIESLVYAEDANWYVGNANVSRVEMANGVYAQLPNRTAMYKISLNQLIPTGDTSISAGSGDQDYSKTPAGVKFQAANLSIDDDDFKDNLYMTYELVAKSMMNVQFANMQGRDLLKLKDEQRDLLIKAGLEFPVDAEGNPTNELEIIWDEARATFTFEVEPEDDKSTDEKEQLEGLMRVLELKMTIPTFDNDLLMSGVRLKTGELLSSIINLTTDNKKIIEEVEPEEAAMGGQTGLPQPQQPQAQGQPQPQAQQPQAQAPQEQEISQEEVVANMQAVMTEYGVDEQTAAAMLEAERQGLPPEQIIASLGARQ